MITKYDFNTKSLKLKAHRKPNRFMKTQGNMDFYYFRADMSVVQIGSFSIQAECDVIYQLS